MYDALLSFCENIFIGALAPIYYLLTSGSVRYYWVYLLAALLIAWIAYARRGDGDLFREELFSRETWASTSARNDYLLLFINPALRLSVLSWLFINGDLLANGVVQGLGALGVSGNFADGPALLIAALLTVTLFLIEDFLRWSIHYLLHKVPVLWEFHKVHHSAEQLNFATAERAHPVELFVFATCSGVVVGIVNGLFIALFGDQMTVATLVGANVFWVGFNMIGGALRHSPFWVSYGPTVERWVISPAMHHVHHSNDPRHFDRNFGGSLAIWDRWFGTIWIPEGREVTSYGIGEEGKEHYSLGAIYALPIQKAYAGLKPSAKHPANAATSA